MQKKLLLTIHFQRICRKKNWMLEKKPLKVNGKAFSLKAVPTKLNYNPISWGSVALRTGQRIRSNPFYETHI